MIRAFTLIELLIVFVLIAMVSTVAGLSFIRMKEQELFYEGVRRVQNAIMLAEEAMQLRGIPTTLSFHIEKGELFMTTKADKVQTDKIKGINRFELKSEGASLTSLLFSPFSDHYPVADLTLGNGKEERSFFFRGAIEFPNTYAPPYPELQWISCDGLYPTPLLAD